LCGERGQKVLQKISNNRTSVSFNKVIELKSYAPKVDKSENTVHQIKRAS
jgi:hypothetical protein